MTDPTNAPEPNAALLAAEKERDAAAAQEAKKAEAIARTAATLAKLIQTAQAERQRRGEHSSNEDIALFLAVNGVTVKSFDPAVLKTPDAWPTMRGVIRVDDDER